MKSGYEVWVETEAQKPRTKPGNTCNNGKLKMKLRSSTSLVALTALLSTVVVAQEETVIDRKIELGALLTSGNTSERSLNFGGAISIDRGKLDYDFTLDGLYASSDNIVKAQRLYGVASANYEITADSFTLSRFSHEDDRFSGFDSQTAFTVSYGRGFLQRRADMGLSVTTGIGVRWSRLDNSDFGEPIFRVAGDYDWTISNSAVFNQELSSETGTDSDIYRSESSIETEILENLTLRLSLKIKHQTVVPSDRDKTDTETAVTFVMNF